MRRAIQGRSLLGGLRGVAKRGAKGGLAGGLAWDCPVWMDGWMDGRDGADVADGRSVEGARLAATK